MNPDSGHVAARERGRDTYCTQHWHLMGGTPSRMALSDMPERKVKARAGVPPIGRGRWQTENGGDG
ncbi:MAG: hypothetical protein AcusKO_34920 [Acuticoccus sp.]